MRLRQLVEALQGLDLAGSTLAVLLHVGCGVCVCVCVWGGGGGGGGGGDDGGKSNGTITTRRREGRELTNYCAESSLSWDWFGCNEGHRWGKLIILRHIL